MEHEVSEHLGGKPSSPRRNGAENDDTRIRLFLQCGDRLGHIIEMLRPGPVQQNDVGPDLPDKGQNLIVDRAAVWRALDIGVLRRNAGIGGKLRDAEGVGFLSLA